MKFFHFLTYAIVLGFFAVACTTSSRPIASVHANGTQSAGLQKRLLDEDLLPSTDAADSVVDRLPQH